VALKRELGTAGVFAMASGAMISSGLFVLPAIVFGVVGPGIFLSYLIAALLLLPSLLSKAELMTAMPKAGGTYFHIDRSMGPQFGTIGGVANWATLAFKGAFALIGIGTFAAFLWPTPRPLTVWEIKGVACGFCILFTVLNLLGTRHAGRIQNILVLLLLLALVAYAALGSRAVDLERYSALLPHGWNKLFVGAGIVFISFGGVTQIANLAEEVRNPKRDLVWGMFAAYAVVGLLYAVVVFVTVGVLPSESGQWQLAPLSQAAGLFGGGIAAAVMGAAALFAYMTTGNAGILTASRTLMAMSQDSLVPEQLGRVSRRRGTPVRAVLLTSVFMAGAILVLNLELFVRAASAMLLLLLIFECLAVVIMRESRIPTYRPTWRSPFYPWPQVAGMVCYVFLLVELGSLPLAIAGAILGAAALWHTLYVRVRVMRESALVRLAERVAGFDFQDHDLEAELSAIVRERDEFAEDRFDRLVARCPVVEVPRHASREELFGLLADRLAEETGLEPGSVREALERREQISSTVIRPGLAVPHLILDDVPGLHLVLARAREGVALAPAEPPVVAVFCLAASPANRDPYLQMLVAISEIAQEPGFDERWLEARSIEGLREAVRSAERTRHRDDAGPREP
jgi:amino acid transporter/mannitol/fructose-specific phosphotransferase system IIA component (Ntr-type)